MEIQVAHLLTSESDECQKRFQAAVDVIQNLPKNGKVSITLKKQSKVLVLCHTEWVKHVSFKKHCRSGGLLTANSMNMFNLMTRFLQAFI